MTAPWAVSAASSRVRPAAPDIDCGPCSHASAGAAQALHHAGNGQAEIIGVLIHGRLAAILGLSHFLSLALKRACLFGVSAENQHSLRHTSDFVAAVERRDVVRQIAVSQATHGGLPSARPGRVMPRPKTPINPPTTSAGKDRYGQQANRGLTAGDEPRRRRKRRNR